AALWRTGHEERRGLRCLAAVVRLTRYPRGDHRGLAQGAAAAAPGGDTELRAVGGGGGRRVQPLGGVAAAIVRSGVVAGARRGAVVGCPRGGAWRGGADRRRSHRGVCRGRLRERTATLSTAHMCGRGRVAGSGAARNAAARTPRRAAHRLGRRAAL